RGDWRRTRGGTMNLSRLILAAAILFTASGLRAADPPTVVALGDSITRGERTGVKKEETFAALLEGKLKDKGPAAKVVNVGVGGERTDGALARLDKAVIALKP